MKRRELLAAAGVAGSGLLGGCSGPLPHVGTVVLNGVFVSNHEGAEHEVRVVVETADERYVDRTVVASPPEERAGTTYVGGAVLECDWPADAAQYTVRARHDGAWRRVEFPRDAEDRCHVVEFDIGGHPGRRDTFESWVRPCLPEDGTRCGYDGNGTPTGSRTRQ